MAEIRETHTHTTTDTGGGSGAGMLMGVVLAIVVLALAAFFLFGAFRGPTAQPAQPTGRDTNIQINPPAQPKVDVQVNPPSQQAPGTGGQSQPAPKAP